MKIYDFLPNNVLNDRSAWDYQTVTLSRVPGFGFGIAVSGGKDNPHFANGDPSIAVSDVLASGPAEDKLQVNDRIITVNGISLENVEYATAVQVLRDSGNTVTLVVKRRIPQGLNGAMLSPSHQHSHSLSSAGLNSNNGSQPQNKVVITKGSKKEDFGIVLGCKLYVKEISSKTKEQLAANGYTLNEGDIITRIHNTNCNDSLSIKEAKKIIDSCKDRLTISVMRGDGTTTVPTNNSGMQSPAYSHTAQVSNCSNIDDNYLSGGASYSAQNLYVQPPTRTPGNNSGDDKSNLTPRGRSRNPLTDISLQQLDRPATPPGGISHSRSRSGIDQELPRPPPPRTQQEDYYSSRRQLYDDDQSLRNKPSEPRYITFQKEGSVGIRLTGGNEVGIFVTAVQQGSPASVQGLVPGDKILKVNDMDMNGVTREEAVLFLLSLQDRIDLIVQYSKEEYDNVIATQRGDSFHIKTHFHYDTPSKGETPFKAGDVFRVVDTLYNGVVGAWQVIKVGRGHTETQRGVIPNKARAEELATAQFNATKKEINDSQSRVGFFRRRRTNHRRSKSLSRENWDDVVFSDSISKFPAYERVVLRHPGFVRPVCLFGPTSDVARERLMKEFPDKFTAPLQDDDKGSKCGIVRLSNIRDIMDRGKHALLDITPNAVDRLNYAQFYPIVIFLKADNKHVIKQLRQGIPKSAHKSSKKLLEQCQKLEKVWSHVFSTTIMLSEGDQWYRKVREMIEQQQSGAVWMSETKPVESLSDDFLFPMNTSRLSYASSPESDLEIGPGPSSSLSLGNLPALVKASSDPSIATNQDNLDRDRELGEGMGLMPPPYTNPYEHATAHQRRLNVETKYGFNQNGSTDDLGSSRIQNSTMLSQNGSQGLYGAVPDLPPRIDRGSKPPGGQSVLPSTPGSSLPSRNSSSLHGNTNSLGRSAHERLFGSKSMDHGDPSASNPMMSDDYATRTQLLGSTDKRNGNGTNSSLDRSKATKMGNSSYDSVSSYDSYNTSQMTPQTAMRLGPNAPDDLKSVPNTNGRPPLTPNQNQEYRTSDVMGSPRNSHLHQDMIGNRNSMHDRSGYNGDISSRSIGSHEPLTPRNSNDRPMNMNIPQRPTNLGLDGPRKQMIDSKVDYGKYSRNNSVSQADYSKSSPKPAHQMGPPQTNGAPFKPVPPPKPKNYRPPVQGEPISPRSPNGFYYPPSSHHHYGQQGMPPQNGNQMQYGQYVTHMGNGYGTNGQQPIYGSREPPMTNGYNGNYGQNYAAMPRGHGVPPVPAHHPSDRRALDLAGSREQRGSAFELYRKPSIGAGVHHGMSDPSQQLMFANAHEYNEYQQFMARQREMIASGAQPALPPKPKKKLLRSPLTAIKNAFIKTTRPLRRQVSLNESDSEPKKLKSILKRQNSMMEPRNMRQRPGMYPPGYDPYSMQQQQYYPPPQQNYMPGQYPMARHEPYYPNDPNSTYTNLESDYGAYGHGDYYEEENIYANRARIELERRALPPVPPSHGVSQYGTASRLMRRHSLRDRRAGNYTPTSETGAYPKNSQPYMEEPIYQSKRGSFLLNETRESARRFEESPYQHRKELHRNHLYQSKEEMQERIHQSRREFEKLSIDENAGSPVTTPTSEELLETKRREMKERGYRSKQQLKDQIYQSRREAMESMAEPVYVSKRELKQETIYESKHETSEENLEKSTQIKKEPSLYKFPPLPPPPKTPPPDPPSHPPSQSKDASKDSNDSTLKSGDQTVISSSKNAPLASIDSEEEDETIKKNNESDIEKALAAAEKIKVTSPLARRPSHISNVIKRTAPVDNAAIYASRTSIETQYVSQASLPIGPPNAQSTPYASDLSLAQAGAAAAKKPWILPTVPREPMTTKGVFDSEGGKLEDHLWNVTLVIPKGAIPPGVKQEVYFTVTDPRMANQVGGPPLDMENGEAMLSPLVMCGPQGLEFQVPVILSIPHCAGATPSLGVSLKATDSEKNLRTEWDNMDLPSNAAASTVSVTVDHF
ncbi:uncharacterized protein LOC134828156 isoform X3 [Culicoides brevitarsis]|uniref:uncharacterized protein LOC134828156 isoform X3 n=1 Tax=Culicoides brevitarsis TaxID=469753 RepID=UPI00307C11EE